MKRLLPDKKGRRILVQHFAAKCVALGNEIVYPKEEVMENG
jgi:hypothetical protein